MATPYGHTALALTWALAVDGRSIVPRRAALAMGCAAAADLDFVPGLLIGDPGRFHHGASHSVLAAVALSVFVLALMRLRGRLVLADLALVAGAFASHLVLDWLTHDPGARRGLPLAWPISGERFAAPLWLVPAVRRAWPADAAWLEHMVWLVLVETALGLPLVLAAWIAAGRPRAATVHAHGGT